MKNRNYLKILLPILVFISTNCLSQMKIGNPGSYFWGETDNNQKIEALCVGDYTNSSAQPNAALDITIPYLFPNTPPLIYQGEAIRSSAASDFDHTWKMFTFPETPKFFVLNPGTVLLSGHQAYDGAASVNDIHLNVIQKGNMNFFTENTLWMRLREQGNFGLSND